jgi:hypothetical protein
MGARVKNEYIVHNDEQYVELIITKKNGEKFITLIDLCDLKIVKMYNWFALSSGYVVCNKNNKVVLLHRYIMNCHKTDFIDHINHNRSDNRRLNLRLCTRSENQRNMSKFTNRSSSKYKGVSWMKNREIWRARIFTNGKEEFLGCFTDEIRAAEAYDKRAKELFKEFANLNFP